MILWTPEVHPEPPTWSHNYFEEYFTIRKYREQGDYVYASKHLLMIRNAYRTELKHSQIRLAFEVEACLLELYLEPVLRVDQKLSPKFGVCEYLINNKLPLLFSEQQKEILLKLASSIDI